MTYSDFSENFPDVNDANLYDFIMDMANDFGIAPSTLCSRLEFGCPISIAALLPEDWDVQSVILDENGELYFNIQKQVFSGTCSELYALLERRKPVLRRKG